MEMNPRCTRKPHPGLRSGNWPLQPGISQKHLWIEIHVTLDAHSQTPDSWRLVSGTFHLTEGPTTAELYSMHQICQPSCPDDESTWRTSFGFCFHFEYCIVFDIAALAFDRKQWYCTCQRYLPKVTGSLYITESHPEEVFRSREVWDRMTQHLSPVHHATIVSPAMPANPSRLSTSY
jgi:hypothetical protein